jgi:hypothetical protein
MMVAFLATMLLVWDFDRAYTPQPDHFLISATSATGTDTLQVVPSAPGACAQAQGATDNTYCAQWPACPQGDTLTILVQAAWGDTLSAPAGPLTCFFSPWQPCVCLASDPQLPPVPQIPPSLLTPPSPPPTPPPPPGPPPAPPGVPSPVAGPPTFPPLPAAAPT